MITNLKLSEMCDTIHQSNLTAGWWTDINTGESILLTRNRPEMMLLVITEISEADEGIQNNLNDDKLPHLPMFNVEIADVAIRLFDLIGSETSVHGELMVDYESMFDLAVHENEYVAYNNQYEKMFMYLINHISKAMEHYRKSRTTEYRIELSRVLASTFAIAHLMNFDLFATIDQKIAFNKNRADHKIENRLLDGGKKV